jgi:hypothetical protein
MPIPEGPIRIAFAQQAQYCLKHGSPFTAAVCDELSAFADESTAFGLRILQWPGDPAASALPLRSAGALNALARSGRAADLTALYPPNPRPEPERLRDGIAAAVAAHDGFLHDFLDRPPQTNEVGRSSSLLGGCLLAAARTRKPLELLEIGSSAGLNLALDRYRYELGGLRWGAEDAAVTVRSTWEGAHPPLDAPLSVAARAGCDVNPLDPAAAADRERLLAYVWPDQAERLERLAAALALAAGSGRHVERADAAEWLSRRLAAPATPGRTRLVMHSIVWQYLSEGTREAIAATMREAGAQAREDAPLAWFSIEPDGKGDGAAMRLTLWPGAAREVVGRADYHGRWSRWG